MREILVVLAIVLCGALVMPFAALLMGYHPW